MRITYNLKFSPAHYHIRERTAPTPGLHYWDIVEKESAREVAFAFDENTAKAIVFALDYTKAVLNGDKTAQKELMNALAKLKN
jgi:hypothetical protein